MCSEMLFKMLTVLRMLKKGDAISDIKYIIIYYIIIVIKRSFFKYLGFH